MSGEGLAPSPLSRHPTRRQSSRASPIMTAITDRPLRERLQIWAFHAAAGVALRSFQRRLSGAIECNRRTLLELLERNAKADFGRRHGFDRIRLAPDPLQEFRRCVPLRTYGDLAPEVARIAAGEPQVLTTDPVHMLAGSAGTTDQPKRIPRTRRAQRHHLQLVVLAEQAVIDLGIRGAREPRRGINLMSVAVPPPVKDSVIPVMSGPNAGMKRLERQIPLLWTSPVPAFRIAHYPTALYLHALFALREVAPLYIQTPFAPQVVGWLNSIEQHQDALVRDLAGGTLSEHLQLTVDERAALAPYLMPAPDRAKAVAAAFGAGFRGIVPRLWPEIRYVRSVTSGSFSLAVPRLRWLVGPDLPIHSGCHSSSEGIIGINLRADGSTDYVLAVGTSYFEFIPVADVDAEQPPTVGLEDLVVGEEYEVVLSSTAGLYRYRLGDIVRITGHYGEAPTFQYLYRRGTVLNLVGEKCTEYHTGHAVQEALLAGLGAPHACRDYAVAGDWQGDRARYTFYVEVAELPAADAVQEAATRLEHALALVNPYYRSSGEGERLGPAVLKVVAPGTFDRLAAQQLAHNSFVNPTQIKTPRVVRRPDQRALLEESVMAHH